MISLHDFLRLSDGEKALRFSELAPEDRLKARMSDWSPKDVKPLEDQRSPEEIKQQEKVMRELEKAIEQGKINLIDKTT